MEVDMNKKNWEKNSCPKHDCRKDSCKGGLRKFSLAAALGDDSKDSPIAPRNGAYCNAIVIYEANNHIYLYSSEGIPTLMSSEAADVEDVIKQLEEDLAKETTNRRNADNILQREIDDIKNSPDVVDIVPTYSALQEYDTSKLGDNDVIRVLYDETHDGDSSYYRWNANTQSWTFVGSIHIEGGYSVVFTTGEQGQIYVSQEDIDYIYQYVPTYIKVSGNVSGTEISQIYVLLGENNITGSYSGELIYFTYQDWSNDYVMVRFPKNASSALNFYEYDFYTKSESDTKFQDKLVSGTNIKTINNESILGSGNIDIEGGYPEVPEKLYEYTNLYDLFNEGVYIDDGIYTVSREWYCEVPKANDERASDNINPNSILYIYRPYGFISWSGPTSSMYWSNGDETFTGGVLTTIDDVNFAIDEKLGSNVVMANTEQTISGKKTFTSNNGTVFENAGGLILKYLSSAPEFKIIPDNNGNFDIYYQNTQLARIDSNYTTLHRGFRPSRSETLDLGSSSYNWNKIYSKILANGSIEKNVVNLLTNDADLVPTYGNSFSIGSSSRLWNTLFASALHNGSTRIAISDIATKTELAGKQDTLTAGTGIAITNNVISSTLEGIDYEVDQELPATGEKGIIYLIPNGSSEQENIYDEYIWIPPLQEGDTGRFEFIGTTQTDLTNYVDLDTAQEITGLKTFVREIDFKYANSSTYKAGIVCPGNNKLGFGSAPSSASGINSYITMDFSSKIFYPGQNGEYSLGTSNSKWNNLYLSGNISDGTNSVSVDKIANVDDVVDLSSAQTISGNKTIASGSNLSFAGTNTGVIENSGNYFRIKLDGNNKLNLNTTKLYSAVDVCPNSPSGRDLGDNSYPWRNVKFTGYLGDTHNNSYGLTLPDTTGFTANKTIATTDQITPQWYGTQAEYDALATKDPDTLYFIEEE